MAYARQPMAYERELSGIRYRVSPEEQVLWLGSEPASSVGGAVRLSARLHEIGAGRNFTSASALALKAKQFDDGLYAAVEIAAFQAKSRLVEQVLARLANAPGGPARAKLAAAFALGRGEHALDPAAERERTAFLGDALRSKPIGFYTWSEDLTRIFQHDRMLQSDLSGEPDAASVAAAIADDASLAAAYAASLRLPARLTNALACADLRSPIAPGRATAFFPPSRAHETDLVSKMFGSSPIPEGFELMKELVARIRDRRVDLTPLPDSGWYDVQTWALETLVAPERGIEAARLQIHDGYREHLVELFRGILTATRETHAKQLAVPLAGCAAPRQPQLPIRPELTVEPLVTHYLRRADSYRFVRGVLVEAFGDAGLAVMRGQRNGRRIEMPLGDELASMIHLFDGAAGAAMQELGMPVTHDRRAFDAWRGGAGDPDVAEDIRAMVPVFYDVERRQTKVWMILGWAQRSLEAGFVTPPKVEITNGKQAEISFTTSWYPIATPVMVEAYVSRILDRTQFRALCDAHATPAAIVAAI